MRGAHRQAHERAGGRWAIYWYAWRGGPRIAVYDGATRKEAEAKEASEEASLALLRAYADARDTRPAIGLFGRVVCEYIASDDYKSLKWTTRATKRVWLDRISERFGHCTLREIDMDAVAAWLKDVKAAHGARASDHAKSALSSVANWGAMAERPKELRLPRDFKPTENFRNAYRAPPQEAWRPEEIARIPSIRREEVRWALQLALQTGLRRTDLVQLPWNAIDPAGGVIRWVPSKGKRLGRRIVIPMTSGLRSTLALIPKRSTIILTNAHQRPWTVNGLAHAVNEALREVGIKKRLHGLRRSTATYWASEGWSSRQIALIMGWSEREAEAMSAIYIDDEQSLSKRDRFE